LGVQHLGVRAKQRGDRAKLPGLDSGQFLSSMNVLEEDMMPGAACKIAKFAPWLTLDSAGVKMVI
jgi:hypothetical protein